MEMLMPFIDAIILFHQNSVVQPFLLQCCHSVKLEKPRNETGSRLLWGLTLKLDNH